jgi:hypothetical protein
VGVKYNVLYWYFGHSGLVRSRAAVWPLLKIMHRCKYVKLKLSQLFSGYPLDRWVLPTQIRADRLSGGKRVTW